MRSLVLYGRALKHAETVLFVNDDEAEPLEGEFFLEEGVSPDDHVGLARGRGGMELFFFSPFPRACR
jgi:hypothetical protein